MWNKENSVHKGREVRLNNHKKKNRPSWNEEKKQRLVGMGVGECSCYKKPSKLARKLGHDTT